MKLVTILGSTGSIGCNTLDIIAKHSDRFQVFALSARSSIDKLFEQCKQFKPSYAVLLNQENALRLQQWLTQAGLKTEVLSSKEDLANIASHPSVDYVMAAIVGAAGLLPTLAAAKAGKRVLLANKESLVMMGELFMQAIHANNAELLPIDSEHNAIFQCLEADKRKQFKSLILTGSGGPFRTLSLDDFPSITPEQAIAHPNWSMGKKISVDSATMLNKGLEYIEARWLFNTHKIEILLHPQSIIHSMVRFMDGSILAQLGPSDMRIPIAYGLSYPERITTGLEPLDFSKISQLTFEELDYQRYPCLKLSIDAFNQGGLSSIYLNAANEVAVGAFLERKISFSDIYRIIASTLEKMWVDKADQLDKILAADEHARLLAQEIILKI